MSEGEGRGRGISESLKVILQSFLGATHNRIELFAVEFQEETIRCVELVILAMAVVALGMAALGLITAAAVMWLPGSARLLALAFFGLCYLLAAGWAYRTLSRRLRKATPFAGTLEEIRKDRECLQAKS